MEYMFKLSSFDQNISGWSVSLVSACTDFSLQGNLAPINSPNFTNCTP
jgi:hypothetical protein